jgi:hypothetical protein
MESTIKELYTCVLRWLFGFDKVRYYAMFSRPGGHSHAAKGARVMPNLSDSGMIAIILGEHLEISSERGILIPSRSYG